MQPVPQLPVCVCGSLRQVTRAITQMYDEALRPSGLRSMQFHLLMTIQAVAEATLTELGHILTMDQTTLTRSLLVLERQGWVQRRPRKDKRQKALALTQEGHAVLAVAQPLWAIAQARALEHMGEPAWQLARTPLNRLLKHASAASPSAQPGSPAAPD